MIRWLIGVLVHRRNTLSIQLSPCGSPHLPACLIGVLLDPLVVVGGSHDVLGAGASVYIFLSCLLFGVYAGVVWMYALSKEAYVCFFVGFGHV